METFPGSEKLLSLATESVSDIRHGHCRPVIIESPYAPGNGFTTLEHVAYARRAMMDSLRRAEAPLVPHLLYTQVLDDTDPEQRRVGLGAHISALEHYARAGFLVAFYGDYGLSPGMAMAQEAVRNVRSMGYPVNMTTRYIGR